MGYDKGLGLRFKLRSLGFRCLGKALSKTACLDSTEVPQ